MEIRERQLDIIQAAGTILTRSGLGGLTVKNLASEMAFSESALYRHFKSKEEIILAMLKFLAADMDKRLSLALADELDPESKLQILFEDQFRFFNNNPHFVVAVFSDCLMEESNSINERILALMAIKTKHVLPIIKQGQKQGIFTKEIKAEALMHIILGAFRLQMFKWKSENFRNDILKEGKLLVKSMLLLIKTKK